MSHSKRFAMLSEDGKVLPLSTTNSRTSSGFPSDLQNESNKKEQPKQKKKRKNNLMKKLRNKLAHKGDDAYVQNRTKIIEEATKEEEMRMSSRRYGHQRKLSSSQSSLISSASDTDDRSGRGGGSITLSSSERSRDTERHLFSHILGGSKSATNQSDSNAGGSLAYNLGSSFGGGINSSSGVGAGLNSSIASANTPASSTTKKKKSCYNLGKLLDDTPSSGLARVDSSNDLGGDSVNKLFKKVSGSGSGGNSKGGSRKSGSRRRSRNNNDQIPHAIKEITINPSTDDSEKNTRIVKARETKESKRLQRIKEIRKQRKGSSATTTSPPSDNKNALAFSSKSGKDAWHGTTPSSTRRIPQAQAAPAMFNTGDPDTDTDSEQAPPAWASEFSSTPFDNPFFDELSPSATRRHSKRALTMVTDNNDDGFLNLVGQLSSSPTTDDENSNNYIQNESIDFSQHSFSSRSSGQAVPGSLSNNRLGGALGGDTSDSEDGLGIISTASSRKKKDQMISTKMMLQLGSTSSKNKNKSKIDINNFDDLLLEETNNLAFAWANNDKVQCICGRKSDCYDVSSGFFDLDVTDPRSGYTALPPHKAVQRRSLFLENLVRKCGGDSSTILKVSSQSQQENDASSGSNKLWIANHHFHPRIILSSTNNDVNNKSQGECYVPKFVSEIENIKYKIGLSKNEEVLNDKMESTGYYYFVPNYSFTETTNDLLSKLSDKKLKVEQMLLVESDDSNDDSDDDSSTSTTSSADDNDNEDEDEVIVTDIRQISMHRQQQEQEQQQQQQQQEQQQQEKDVSSTPISPPTVTNIRDGGAVESDDVFGEIPPSSDTAALIATTTDDTNNDPNNNSTTLESIIAQDESVLMGSNSDIQLFEDYNNSSIINGYSPTNASPSGAFKKKSAAAWSMQLSSPPGGGKAIKSKVRETASEVIDDADEHQKQQIQKQQERQRQKQRNQALIPKLPSMDKEDDDDDEEDDSDVSYWDESDEGASMMINMASLKAKMKREEVGAAAAQQQQEEQEDEKDNNIEPSSSTSEAFETVSSSTTTDDANKDTATTSRIQNDDDNISTSAINKKEEEEDVTDSTKVIERHTIISPSAAEEKKETDGSIVSETRVEDGFVMEASAVAVMPEDGSAVSTAENVIDDDDDDDDDDYDDDDGAAKIEEELMKQLAIMKEKQDLIDAEDNNKDVSSSTTVGERLMVEREKLDSAAALSIIDAAITSPAPNRSLKDENDHRIEAEKSASTVVMTKQLSTPITPPPPQQPQPQQQQRQQQQQGHVRGGSPQTRVENMCHKLQKFERQRQKIYVPKLQKYKTQWHAAIEIIRAGVNETLRAERMTLATAIANEAYAEAMQAIYDDVYLDDDGNLVDRESLTGAWKRSSLLAKRSTEDYSLVSAVDDETSSVRRDSQQKNKRASVTKNQLLPATEGGERAAASAGGGMVGAVIETKSTLAARFKESAKTMRADIQHDLTLFRQNLQRKVDSIDTSIGDAYISKLEMVEQSVQDKWCAFESASVRKNSESAILQSGNNATFFNEDEDSSSIKDKALYGAGVAIAMNEGGKLVVSGVQPHSPAYKAGIKANDIFIDVGGTLFNQGGTVPTDVANELRGPEGSKVGVVVEREGKLLDFVITRSPISIPTDGNKALSPSPGDVGVTITKDEYGLLIVSDVEADSEAACVGILPSDTIVEIDGACFTDSDASPDDAAEKLRGQAGSDASVVIERYGEIHEYTLTRRATTKQSADNRSPSKEPSVAKSLPQPSGKPPTEDSWILEMTYRISVAYQALVWSELLPELLMMSSRLSEIEIDRREQMPSLLLGFVPRQIPSCISVHHECLEEMSVRHLERDVENDINEILQKQQKLIQQASTEHRSSIMNRSRRKTNLHDDLSIDIPTLESDLANDLVLISLMIERQFKSLVGYGDQHWQKSMAVVTADQVVHFFDLPQVLKGATKPDEIFALLKPPITNSFPTLETIGNGNWEPTNKNIIKDVTPVGSSYIPNCAITTSGQDDKCTFEITEDTIGMFGKTSTRKFLLRTKTEQEREQLIRALFGSSSSLKPRSNNRRDGGSSNVTDYVHSETSTAATPYRGWSTPGGSNNVDVVPSETSPSSSPYRGWSSRPGSNGSTPSKTSPSASPYRGWTTTTTRDATKLQ